MRTRRSSFGWLVVTLACAAACGDDTGSGGLGGGGAPQGGGGVGGESTGGAPVGGDGGTGGEGGAGPQTPCEAICTYFEDLEVEVMCGYDGSSCVPECEAGFGNLPAGCDDEAIAYNDCLIEQPAAGYNCTNGIFTLTNGACDEQLNALTACS